MLWLFIMEANVSALMSTMDVLLRCQSVLGMRNMLERMEIYL